MSGQGKTTVARGLMALFEQKGLKVQPFKCGPDYIDTKFHERVCRRPSINLDSFMASEPHLRQLYRQKTAGADVSIVEGMMGLFDGYDRDRGSSAEIARILQLPIVLVVDARSAAYSMAALLSGFIHFQSDLQFAGVIFNKVGSPRHYDMLRQVCYDLHIDCLGYLPRQSQLEQASRYLGLDFSAQSESNALVELLEKHVDWQRLLSTGPENANYPDNTESSGLSSGFSEISEAPRVLVARNSESFSFLYHEHLEQWRHATFFDPETEVPSLDDIDLLYLPGGYPEKHLEALAAASDTRQAIRHYAAQGGRILAECGGMMYLCQSIVTDEGEHSMCGVLPYRIGARRQDRKLSLGYRQLRLGNLQLRGHEFHYTQFLDALPASITQVYNAKGEPVSTPVFRQGNVIASYTHLYWGEQNIMKIFEP